MTKLTIVQGAQASCGHRLIADSMKVVSPCNSSYQPTEGLIYFMLENARRSSR